MTKVPLPIKADINSSDRDTPIAQMIVRSS